MQFLRFSAGLFLCFFSFVLDAAEVRIALLLDEPAGRAPSIESLTVSEIADRIGDVARCYLDESGNKLSFVDQCDILWCHLSRESIVGTPFESEPFCNALRDFTERGGSLFLSGGAPLILGPLKLDAVTTTPLDFGNDRSQTGFASSLPAHPIYANLDWDRGVLWLSNTAYPVFASFSAPNGIVLGVNPGTSDAPILEYSSAVKDAVKDNANKSGRIIVVPWHVGAIYDKAPAGHRKNLESLFSNIVRYLAGSLTESAAIPSPFHTESLALERAIRHLTDQFKSEYPRGEEFLKRLDDVRRLHKSDSSRDAQLATLRREALFAHPQLDFENILLVRRSENQLGLPLNHGANSSLPKTGYDNTIQILTDWKTRPTRTPLFQPNDGRFVGDLDLHFDAERALMSLVDDNNLWRVCEINIDDGTLKHMPQIPDADVDNYDACYLPDDGIVFCSTACFTGVPCVNGSALVCNLYRLYPDGIIRQLTYEQDQDWCPTLLNNGRLLYLRWEYSDLPHAFSRILFHANTDGTNQAEYYGSGSYYPASMFFAKPIPNHPTKFVAVVGGHHELPRQGDLVLFDPALGRHEASGAIQRIPGHGRVVEPVALDLPVEKTFPKFLHPAPIDEHFFLVSAKLDAASPWGVYLVDTFDNIVLIDAEPGYALFEPIPIQKRERQPAILDRIDPSREDADVFIADIYRGEGLKGVSRGSVKSLRIFSYQFAYQGIGAEPYSVGMDGPWDPRRILGTVPVYDDGSANFRIPAYTPISIQPLDSEGKAIQQLRSWITAMPGETVSCVGCHEEQNTTVIPVHMKAATAPPSDITPWFGEPRGFSFVREVQPVLDKYCVSCHFTGNTEYSLIASFEDGPAAPLQKNDNYINVKSRFSRAYYELRRFVRTPTKESTMTVLMPREYHADTTRLVQLLEAGHYGVVLDAEAWERLITWIDLNAPFHGNWTDIAMGDSPGLIEHQFARRHNMRRRFAQVETLLDDHPSHQYSPAILSPHQNIAAAKIGMANEVKTQNVETAARSAPPSPEAILSIPLSESNSIECVAVQGTLHGTTLWLGRTEVTNAQFAIFDPNHNSGIEYGDFMHFSPGERGWSLSHPSQPVVRVSWNEAEAFCRWLSEKTGKRVSLPTESQWELACRAGTTTPFWYGSEVDDFSSFANVSDVCNQTIDPFSWAGRPDVLPPWRPADARFDDGSRVSAPVASYRPNPWGLYDMHGNVAEWTSSDAEKLGHKIVKGGSWYDPPNRSGVEFRQNYLAEQPVFDVGFRVVVETEL